MSADPDAPATRTFRLVLEYDGRDFEGWQVQTSPRAARTVQGELVAAAERVTGSTARIRGAGRTDAGVHALAQVASLRIETGLAPEQLRRALNGHLARDLAVLSLDEVPADWDALREARGKHYRYQIWNGRERSPLRAGRFHWIRERLDVEAMREAAHAFVGTHDFAALQGAGSDVKTTVRTIQALEITGRPGHEVGFEVEGEGFLRHMVRNLAGTLVEIGRGRWPPGRTAEILASRDRQQAGPTAPADGLLLVAVRDTWSMAAENADAAHCARTDSVDEDSPVG